MLSTASPVFPLPAAMESLPRSPPLSTPILSPQQSTTASNEPLTMSYNDNFEDDMPEPIEIDSQEDLSERCPERAHLRFENLPIEIHEAILDHLFGVRGSAIASISTATSTPSSWSRSLRHPRRKALSNLALVSPIWRPLVQERIYRHIQAKGTSDGLQESADWFGAHPHLTPHVRHIEIWVPVWGDRLPKTHTLSPNRREYGLLESEPGGTLMPQASMSIVDNFSASTTFRSNRNFKFASRNASLQQIFFHVATFFPDARMMTIEGGHCKKPPMIRHFDNDHWGGSGSERLEVLPNIQSFAMRGAWNIMRDYQHWCNLSTALPNLREWNCAYAKPKIEGQATIRKILTDFPSRISRLSISLDGFCSKAASHTRWFVPTQNEYHLCRLLGAVMPQLESLTFTGKACSNLFTCAKAALTKANTHPILKSVDIVVKACCCEPHAHEEGSVVPQGDLTGITNMCFVSAFEKLIVSAVSSLEFFDALNHLRIRYIDLDSACGLLNPYFQLKGNTCTGLWSEKILLALQSARHTAHFEELADGIVPEYGVSLQTGTRTYPRTRPRSIRADAYKMIADASKP